MTSRSPPKSICSGEASGRLRSAGADAGGGGVTVAAGCADAACVPRRRRRRRLVSPPPSPPAAMARSASSRVMRPPGPVPCTSVAVEPGLAQQPAHQRRGQRLLALDVAAHPTAPRTAARSVPSAALGSRSRLVVGASALPPRRSSPRRRRLGRPRVLRGRRRRSRPRRRRRRRRRSSASRVVAGARGAVTDDGDDLADRDLSSTSALSSWTVPATGEGISVSTLSVEISTMGWSTSTSSPTSTSQAVMTPSVTDSPSWGSSTSVATCALLRAVRVSVGATRAPDAAVRLSRAARGRPARGAPRRSPR